MADTDNLTSYDSMKKFKTGNDDNDRLSKLPRTVLAHILSLLPTKDAVRTSVLSTEWTYMWTLSTNLHLYDLGINSFRIKIKAMFMNFVERVLLLHGNPILENFYLSCAEEYDEPRFKSWISAAIRRNAKRLRIYCSRMKPGFVFPRCIYESKSLTELELRMHCVLRFPSSTSTYFSSLKNLNLCEVMLYNGSLSVSNELHLCFPMLEVLYLENCRWMNVETVNIYAPALEICAVTCESCDKWTWTPAIMLDCVVNINGSCITKFKFHGDSLISQYNLRSPSSVVDATIEVSTLVRNRGQIHEFGLRTFSLLSQFSNVKSLALSNATIKALARLEDLQDCLPTFDNLINLTFSGGGLVIDTTFMTLLRRSSALESLIFAGGISRFNEDEVVQGTVPLCLVSHLKMIIFQTFSWKEAEVEAAKFFLKNAKLLEKMTIVACEGLPQNEETKSELLTLPKGSSCATLLFS